MYTYLYSSVTNCAPVDGCARYTYGLGFSTFQLKYHSTEDRWYCGAYQGGNTDESYFGRGPDPASWEIYGYNIVIGDEGLPATTSSTAAAPGATQPGPSCSSLYYSKSDPSSLTSETGYENLRWKNFYSGKEYIIPANFGGIRRFTFQTFSSDPSADIQCLAIGFCAWQSAQQGYPIFQLYL
jgi:hypothetical protein